MNKTKLFNKWISNNFRGLSLDTLAQFIKFDDCQLPSFYKWPEAIDDLIYVQLYHVFTKSYTEDEFTMFELLKNMVNNCAWL